VQILSKSLRFLGCLLETESFSVFLPTGDDPSSLRLLYTDKQLEDNDTFLDHQIKDRSTLFMVLQFESLPESTIVLGYYECVDCGLHSQEKKGRPTVVTRAVPFQNVHFSVGPCGRCRISVHCGVVCYQCFAW
uniref:Ubiquitin-like domain-containing protein n=1 Tax=Sinocyclocheilus anshuiensis TaxID=1608454 RepID=A0A671P718_9TELE